jgi:hypothetical protein
MRRGYLLGCTCLLLAPGVASAADLPARKAAPISYVRICDAYGAGFFYIPGTDTCLKIGGLVVSEGRAFNPHFNIVQPIANGTPKGSLLPAGSFTNQRSKDAYGFSALGRLEMDARTATAWGTLRTLIRVDSYYGSSTLASTGSFTAGAGGTALTNTTANTNTIPRISVIPSKAFIQFAGLTAGYSQSMFDFYADAYNFEGLKGSNSTSALFAYTSTFGQGFSATLSFEDGASRRAAVGNTITAAGNNINGVAVAANPAGGRIPEIVANIRWDQPWGAVQLSGAAHQLDTSLYSATANTVPPTTAAFPIRTSDSYGFAGQIGLMYNLDSIAPGDKLWLQATYEKGAASYVEGTNTSFINGAPSGNRFPGTNNNFPSGFIIGQHNDCVWATTGGCERTQAFAVLAALKHYWTPTISSSAYGSYLQISNTQNALNGAGGAIGAVNVKDIRLGTNLLWTPVKGFDLGGEFMFIRDVNSGPAVSGQFIPLITGATASSPAFRASQNIYEGRIRAQRAF